MTNFCMNNNIYTKIANTTTVYGRRKCSNIYTVAELYNIYMWQKET